MTALTREELIRDAEEFLRASGYNTVPPEEALEPELAGLEIFEAPIFGFGRADDPMFEELKDPRAVHPECLPPRAWVEDGETVISFFFPYTPEVRAANGRDLARVSRAWLHGRIEGQELVAAYSAHLRDLLRAAGWTAAAPSLEPRFRKLGEFASNWSERHVAYVCGLGTFGLSRGLITEKGMAGRFGSVVTSCPLPPTRRWYTSLTQSCILCGKCARNCPAGAIDPARGALEGKDHIRCLAWLNTTYQPPAGPRQKIRYGCGKCQVRVPCEARAPLGPAAFAEPARTEIS